MSKVVQTTPLRSMICLSLLALGGLSTGRAEAAIIYATNTSNQLLRFNSSTPGTLDQTTSVTGLGQGENLLGLDFRPATGQLYALSSASALYTINTSSGAASAVGSAGQFTLSGTLFGFDFNPTVDRIRITSNNTQNIRVNPITGALTLTDASLNYAAGDPNAGTSPQVTSSAYTNSFAGAGSTVLYDIDFNLGILAIQNPPNGGVLNTVGSLGITASAASGFDIEPISGLAYAIFRNVGNTGSNLYRINLGTGAATLIGGVGSSQLVTGLAVVSDAPEPATFGLIGLGLAAIYFRRKF